LNKNPAEVAQIGQDFLASVTEFFRDPEVFTALDAQLVKSVQTKQPGDEYWVRIAGCATGEVAYLVAILLLDILDRHKASLHIKVFATDLDPDAILGARAGIYTDKEVAKILSNLLLNYFEKRAEGRFEVTKRVRDAVVFARQDMIQNPHFVKLDFISCRNVLI
jgi:two-component system CheB/CheR fusion protein